MFTLSRDGQLAPDTLVPVPGGIAVVAVDATPRQRPLAVVVYQLGRATEVTLPSPPTSEAGFAGLRLDVSWPWLTVHADAGTGHFVWSSLDGGATWTLTG